MADKNVGLKAMQSQKMSKSKNIAGTKKQERQNPTEKQKMMPKLVIFLYKFYFYSNNYFQNIKNNRMNQTLTNNNTLKNKNKYLKN
jgi:hypothetical protein